MTYPILLDLSDGLVLVIGGGRVAARKVRDLLDAGAQRITLFSPALHPALLAISDNLTTFLFPYRSGLLAEFRPMMVFACTDSAEVNQQVADEAHELGILVNVADDGSASNFSSMAASRRGDITIAIATGGASPALSVHLRAKLDTTIGSEYATFARWLGDLRPLVKAQINSGQRPALWHSLIDSPALDRLRAGDEAGARAIIDTLVTRAVEGSH